MHTSTLFPFTPEARRLSLVYVFWTQYFYIDDFKNKTEHKTSEAGIKWKSEWNRSRLCRHASGALCSITNQQDAYTSWSYIILFRCCCCCWHHTLFSAVSLYSPHSQNIKMYHIKNMKCVNNKMAIRIWNAKLLGCNRHEWRDRESVYKAWIIKGPIEFVLWPKCKAASTLVSFFFIYGMNTSLSTFNGLWDVWSYRTLTDIKKWNVFEHHFDSRFGKKWKEKLRKSEHITKTDAEMM